MELTKERQNFLKLSCILLDIVTKHLRELFKTKWNAKHQDQPWNSDYPSGNRLYNELSPGFKNNKSKKAYIDKMITGNEKEWDTLTLVHVMLESGLNLFEGCRKVSKRSIPLRTSEKIDIIRNIRNGFFAHLPSMSCSSDDFETVVKDIKSIAKSLFGEEVEKEIGMIENSPVDTKIIENFEKLLKNVIKDVEKDLHGKCS